MSLATTQHPNSPSTAIRAQELRTSRAGTAAGHGPTSEPWTLALGVLMALLLGVLLYVAVLQPLAAVVQVGFESLLEWVANTFYRFADPRSWLFSR